MGRSPNWPTLNTIMTSVWRSTPPDANIRIVPSGGDWSAPTRSEAGLAKQPTWHRVQQIVVQPKWRTSYSAENANTSTWAKHANQSERFKKHIQAIRDCSHRSMLQEHFRTGNCASRNLDNITVQILHVVDSQVVTLVAERELKAIETLWIDRLMSQYPQGLNTLWYDPNECHQLP